MALHGGRDKQPHAASRAGVGSEVSAPQKARKAPRQLRLQLLRGGKLIWLISGNTSETYALESIIYHSMAKVRAFLGSDKPRRAGPVTKHLPSTITSSL